MENRLLDMLYFILQGILDDEMNLREDNEEIRSALLSEGYHEEEIDLALSWLESYFKSLPRRADAPDAVRMPTPPRSIRVLSFDERLRIIPEAHGFLVALESRGFIGLETKEEILHRALGMFEDSVDVEEMKIVTLLTLFEEGRSNLDEIVRMINGYDLKTLH
jgi:uncharacterized protein Smg (DUF494 family)